ncbi:MAG: hypothetical protein QG629_413 [Patescibacteria group bacterium]|nr:hypothetical protein [Patescibacteria group bacterium]
MDRNTGKYFDLVDIDLTKTTQYMRDSGLSDEQISGLTINVTRQPKRLADTDSHTYGRYTRKNKGIQLYFSDTTEILNDQIGEARDDFAKLILAELTTMEASDTLAHEIEHYKVDMLDEFSEERSQHRREGRRLLGKHVLGQAGLMSTYVGSVLTVTHYTDNLAVSLAATAGAFMTIQLGSRKLLNLLENALRQAYDSSIEEDHCFSVGEQMKDSQIAVVLPRGTLETVNTVYGLAAKKSLVSRKD